MEELRRFSGRVRLEGLLNAVAAGLAAACGWALLAAILHRLAVPSPAWLVPAGITAAALIGGAASLWRQRPRPYALARRLDRLGLEDRAVTMVEYQRDTSDMAALQRQDTEEKLRALPTSALPLQVSRLWLLVVVLAVAAAALWLIPAGGQTARVSASQAEGQRLIDQMTLELEEKIRTSELSEEEKARLMEQLSEWVARQPETEEEMLQRLAELESFQADLEDQTLLASQTDTLAALLIRYPITRELGRAILNESQQALGDAFTNMARTMVTTQGTANLARVAEMAEATDSIRRSMGMKNYDFLDISLFAIVRQLSQGLTDAAALEGKASGEAVRVSIEIARSLAFDLLVGDGAESPNDQEQELDENTAPNRSESERIGAGDEESGEQAVSGVRITGGAEGSGLGVGKNQKRDMTELYYDPARDTGRPAGYVPGAEGADGAPAAILWREEDDGALVPYGEVFGVYYADYLEESLPEEIRDEVSAYFDTL